MLAQFVRFFVSLEACMNSFTIYHLLYAYIQRLQLKLWPVTRLARHSSCPRSLSVRTPLYSKIVFYKQTPYHALSHYALMVSKLLFCRT